jgi:predicted TIM-barrel fold metal-dependent hydrolase
VKWISASHPQGRINKMTVEQMKELAELGVYICIQNQTIYSHDLNDETLEMIKQVPVDKLVYGSDLTMWGGVHPVDGVRLLIEVLLGYGVPEETVRKIFIDNPKKLLFG